MKKFLFILIIVVCSLVSCSKASMDEDKCYKITYVMENGQPMMEYRWMSENDANWQKSHFKKLGYTDIHFSHDIMKKTFQDCWESDTTTHLCGKYKF